MRTKFYCVKSFQNCGLKWPLWKSCKNSTFLIHELSNVFGLGNRGLIKRNCVLGNRGSSLFFFHPSSLYYHCHFNKSNICQTIQYILYLFSHCFFDKRLYFICSYTVLYISRRNLFINYWQHQVLVHWIIESEMCFANSYWRTWEPVWCCSWGIRLETQKSLFLP